MDMQHDMQRKMPYFIRVTSVELFNALYQSIEERGFLNQVSMQRNAGFYELHTDDVDIWHELSLYAQMLAQAQDTFVETGEEKE